MFLLISAVSCECEFSLYMLIIHAHFILITINTKFPCNEFSCFRIWERNGLQQSLSSPFHNIPPAAKCSKLPSRQHIYRLAFTLTTFRCKTCRHHSSHYPNVTITASTILPTARILANVHKITITSISLTNVTILLRDAPPPPSSPSPSSLDSPSYRETKCMCASVWLLSITGQQATWVRQAHLSHAVTLPLTNWSAKGAHLRAGAVGGALYGRWGLAGGEGLQAERACGRRGLSERA